MKATSGKLVVVFYRAALACDLNEIIAKDERCALAMPAAGEEHVDHGF
jgi:hypothetical protein